MPARSSRRISARTRRCWPSAWWLSIRTAGRKSRMPLLLNDLRLLVRAKRELDEIRENRRGIIEANAIDAVDDGLFVMREQLDPDRIAIVRGEWKLDHAYFMIAELAERHRSFAVGAHRCRRQGKISAKHP